MKTGKVTGADVARAAGVSRATVSYVMNDTAGQTIPEETRKRVLGAARKLGYVPHMAGRTLRTGRSDLVVWVLPDWPIGSEVGKLIESLSAEATKRRFTLAIVQESEGPARLDTTLRTLAPAALIAMHELPKSVRDFARTTGVPIANTWHESGKASGSAEQDLASSAHLVGELQLRYLADRGHERIAYLYPDDERVRIFADARFAGVRDAAKAIGLPAPRKRTVALDRRRLGEIAREWRDAGVTAVCAYNDEWAMGLISGMHLAGLAVPEDLAVIGCDNVLTSPVTAPPLTTVDQDITHYAVTLMDMVELALGTRTDSSLTYPVIRVVPRESA